MDQNLIQLAEKTLIFLKKNSWSSLEINDVYSFSKLNKKKFEGKIKRKIDLINNIISFFDHKLVKDSKNIEQSSSKDMIFELIMLRFDILQNYRKQILNIYNSIKSKPQTIVMMLPSFLESMIMMAKISNISLKGIKGSVKIKGLLIIYFSSFLVWSRDNTSSLEKTMMSLDKYLNQAEKLLKVVGK